VKVHCIPGVAADARFFSKLRIGVLFQVLELPDLPEGATIRDQAEELLKAIDPTEKNVLIGVSMGGMIAQEIANMIAVDRVIIISSWKGPEEMPVALKALRGTHPERVLNPKFIDRILPLLYWQMGAEHEDDRELVRSFALDTPVEKIRMQLNASLNWNGPEKPVDRLVHIHGDNDHLMPIAHIKKPIVVAGGGHIMVYNKADQVSAIIKQHLSE